MKNGQKIRQRRKFSEELKKFIVSEYESGKFTVSELSRLHDISFQVIYRWIYKYSLYNKQNTVGMELKESSQRKLKAYERRIKELEQIVGQKQLKIDYLEKIIDLSNDHFDTDLKKSFNIRPSNGSERIDAKWVIP